MLEKIRGQIQGFQQQLEVATMNLTAWEVKTTKLRLELDEAKKKVRVWQDKVAHIRGALVMCQTIVEEEEK